MLLVVVVVLVGVVVVRGPSFYHREDQKDGVCCDKYKYTHPKPVTPMYTLQKHRCHLHCYSSCHDSVHRKLIWTFVFLVYLYHVPWPQKKFPPLCRHFWRVFTGRKRPQLKTFWEHLPVFDVSQVQSPLWCLECLWGSESPALTNWRCLVTFSGHQWSRLRNGWNAFLLWRPNLILFRFWLVILKWLGFSNSYGRSQITGRAGQSHDVTAGHQSIWAGTPQLHRSGM